MNSRFSFITAINSTFYTPKSGSFIQHQSTSASSLNFSCIPWHPYIETIIGNDSESAFISGPLVGIVVTFAEWLHLR